MYILIFSHRYIGQKGLTRKLCAIICATYLTLLLCINDTKTHALLFWTSTPFFFNITFSKVSVSFPTFANINVEPFTVDSNSFERKTSLILATTKESVGHWCTVDHRCLYLTYIMFNCVCKS